MIFIGVPVLALENMFGQMTQRSAIKAFSHVRPFLWGLGAYVTWAAFMVVSYYNVIMAWSLEYLYYSFQSPLPWGDTTETAEDFFFDRVLRMGKGDGGDRWTLHDGMGALNWPLLLALLAQWLLVFACVCRMTSTGESSSLSVSLSLSPHLHGLTLSLSLSLSLSFLLAQCKWSFSSRSPSLFF